MWCTFILSQFCSSITMWPSINRGKTWKVKILWRTKSTVQLTKTTFKVLWRVANPKKTFKTQRITGIFQVLAMTTIMTKTLSYTKIIINIRITINPQRIATSKVTPGRRKMTLVQEKRKDCWVLLLRNLTFSVLSVMSQVIHLIMRSQTNIHSFNLSL